MATEALDFSLKKKPASLLSIKTTPSPRSQHVSPDSNEPLLQSAWMVPGLSGLLSAAGLHGGSGSASPSSSVPPGTPPPFPSDSGPVSSGQPMSHFPSPFQAFLARASGAVVPSSPIPPHTPRTLSPPHSDPLGLNGQATFFSPSLAFNRRRRIGSNASVSSSIDDDSQSPPKRIRSIPDEQKDDSYWERRRKNNMAAKRSRDARRAKEDEVALRAALLEQENLKLRAELTVLKQQTSHLHLVLYEQSQARRLKATP